MLCSLHLTRSSVWSIKWMAYWRQPIPYTQPVGLRMRAILSWLVQVRSQPINFREAKDVSQAWYPSGWLRCQFHAVSTIGRNSA